MKKTSLIIGLLLLANASCASTQFSSGGRVYLAPVGHKTYNAPGYIGLGINYGNKDVFDSAGAFSTSSVISDLEGLYSDGFRKVRIAMPDYTNAVQWQHVRAIATEAHAIGLHTMCGLSSNPTIITNANRSTWKTSVAALAPTVQGLCDVFEVGNEEEYHDDGSVSNATIRADLKAIATTIKAAGEFTGEVIYTSPGGQDEVDQWTADTSIGALDYVCFNLYGERLSISPQTDTFNFDRNVKQVQDAYGNNACITEFNISAIWSNFTLNDQDVANNVAMRLQVLRNLHFRNTAYFFTYTSGYDEFVAKISRFIRYY